MIKKSKTSKKNKKKKKDKKSKKRGVNMHHKIGHYAFLIGVALAVFAGILTDIIPSSVTVLALIILGLVVGGMNINARETTEFLVAAIALVMLGIAVPILGVIPLIGIYFQAILGNISIFAASAAVIVALKAVKDLAER